MTRAELEHAIRAACDVAGETEIYIVGSQAILGQFPDAPARLRQSAEADVVLKHHPDRWNVVDGALGELSTFHATHGFYVHGVSPATAVVPRGWKGRTIRVRNENTRGCSGWCLEAHDLAASKLAAFRDKDREFVRELLAAELIKPARLVERVRRLPLAKEDRERLALWVRKTAAS